MWLPANFPTPMNNIGIFVVLCVLAFGLMAFANFMERRERKRRDDVLVDPATPDIHDTAA
jgi:hypothetical protein